MKLLGLDTEGVNQNIQQGLNFDTDRITEIAAILYDWDYKQPVKIADFLFNEAGRISVNEELIFLNGMDDAFLTEHGVCGQTAIVPRLEAVNKLIEECDAVVFWNGFRYDMSMLEAMYDRYGVEFKIKTKNKPFIDGLLDLDHPKFLRKLSMDSMQIHYKKMNPFPHRALTDVLTMMSVCEEYDMTRAFESSIMSNVVTVIADFSMPARGSSPSAYDQFEVTKDRVKSLGFHWNPDNKTWSTQMREHRIGPIQQQLAEVRCGVKTAAYLNDYELFKLQRSQHNPF